VTHEIAPESREKYESSRTFERRGIHDRETTSTVRRRHPGDGAAPHPFSPLRETASALPPWHHAVASWRSIRCRTATTRPGSPRSFHSTPGSCKTPSVSGAGGIAPPPLRTCRVGRPTPACPREAILLGFAAVTGVACPIYRSFSSGRSAGGASGFGRVKKNAAPPSGTFCAQMWPPCAWTIALQIARPRPAPRPPAPAPR
jgi:hypothetical protein